MSNALDFAGNKTFKKQPVCTKGWGPCGYTCLPHSKKNCKAALEGQVKSLAEWLERSAKVAEESKPRPDDYAIDKSDYAAVIGLGQKFAEQYIQEEVSYTPEEQKLVDERDRKADELVKRWGEGQEPSDADREEMDRLYAEVGKIDESKRRASISQFGKLRDALLKYQNVDDDDVEPYINYLTAHETLFDRYGEQGAAETEAYISEIVKLTGMKGAASLDDVGYESPRAYASATTRYINVGDNSRETLYHEFGHHVEYETKEFAIAASKWLESRSTGAPQKLRDLTSNSGYDDDEIALPDKFTSPYVGKVYESGWTEVVSVGLEHFTGPLAMKKLHRRDREHFHFTLGVLLAK